MVFTIEIYKLIETKKPWLLPGLKSQVNHVLFQLACTVNSAANHCVFQQEKWTPYLSLIPNKGIQIAFNSVHCNNRFVLWLHEDKFLK